MWTKVNYAAYQAAVREFMEREGLCNLSTKGVEDGVATEGYFSWRSCECCGSAEGGTRFECDEWSDRDNVVKTFEFVCEDCVYYAEYGQLDDTAMLEIELDTTPEEMS